MSAQKLEQKHKRKAKVKRGLIMIEAPKQFHKDCQMLSIDFEKLQSKVKWIFEKWTKEMNPLTGEPYAELMVSKWIRAKMKEAGYSFDSITRTIRNIAPHLLGKQNRKKSAKSGISAVTAAEEQEQPNDIPQITSHKNLTNDLPNYDFDKRGQIIMYLCDVIERQNTEIETLKIQLTKLQRRKSRYLTYTEASEYVRTHRIDTRAAWREFIQSEEFPNNIPKRPDTQYSEWVGWRAFFGVDKASLREKQRKGAEVTSKILNHFVELNARNGEEKE